MHAHRKTSSLKAFTIVELLVVIAIISVLLAFVLPSLSKARERAEQVRDLANIRSGAYHFLTYFNDFKNFMPPLYGTTGYNYGSWYAQLRPYAQLGNPNGTNFREDKPYALLCQSKVLGTSTGGFPHYLYAVNNTLRYKMISAVMVRDQSYRLEELQNVQSTGLMWCGGAAGDSIYYMAIPYYSLTNTFVSGTLASTAQHRGAGNTVAYMDGRAQYVNIGNAPFHDNYTIAEAQVENWSAEIPWVHRSFWGKTVGNTWLAAHYKFND